MFGKQNKVVAIIQARMSSTRFPGKVLEEIQDKTILQHIVERLQSCNEIDEIVIATTVNPNDKAIENLCKYHGYNYFRGNEEDVLQRVIDCAKQHNADWIVDITADCPFVDPKMTDAMIKKSIDKNYDYISNIIVRTFPDGFDVQVYKRKVLEEINKLITNVKYRTHSGWNILSHIDLYEITYKKLLRIHNISAPTKYMYQKWGLTLDTQEDFTLIKHIFDYFYAHGFEKYISFEAVMEYLLANPDLLMINSNIVRKEPEDG